MANNSPYAIAPFDHPKADVILRSSDNTDFRVFKLFLSLASPVFETLFDIPQPAQASKDQETKDGLAVIPVTEDRKTLDTLLRFCYPCTLADDPKLEIFRDALDVLNAAKKYSLDAIEQKARQVIGNPKMLEAEPLRCFAIAHRGGLREETLLAAKYALTQPRIPSLFPEIESISASDLLSLLSYHQRCGEAVYALRLDRSWITSQYRKLTAGSWAFGPSCQCLMANTSTHTSASDRVPQWWEDFVEGTFIQLRDKPCRATVQALADKIVQEAKEKICRACSPRVVAGMNDVVHVFEGKIKEAVSKIELELNF